MSNLQILPKAILRYYEALDRLIANKPINVPKGTKINFDTVALEARRGRGAIKGDSPFIVELKAKILLAARDCENIAKPKQTSKDSDLELKYLKLKSSYDELRRDWEVQAEQLVSVLFELQETKRELQLILEAQDKFIKFKKG